MKKFHEKMGLLSPTQGPFFPFKTNKAELDKKVSQPPPLFFPNLEEEEEKADEINHSILPLAPQEDEESEAPSFETPLFFSNNDEEIPKKNFFLFHNESENDNDSPSII
jgi:hypothetical protein